MKPWIHSVTDDSAWTTEDVERDRSWEVVVTPKQQEELVAALCFVNKQGLELSKITQKAFPLSSLATSLHDIQNQLRIGRGFAVLRGVPTRGYELKELEKIFWGLSTYLGSGVTQNSDSSLIHYVTDGKLRPQQGARGVGNPGKVGLHVDLSDCVLLFCVRQAPDDPYTVLSSSMNVYNEIIRQHPEWLPRLYKGFAWDRMDEHSAGESPVSEYSVPVFSQSGGKVSCRFNSSWILKGLERLGRSLSQEEEVIFEFIRDTAAENSYAFPLNAGDIAICNNYTVFHGRASHQFIEEEDLKRILMRIWLDIPDVRPFVDEGRVRYGVIRHGNLGWTANDLIVGNNKIARRRRVDGVPLVEN